MTAVSAAASDTAAVIMQAAARIAASGDSSPRPAPDPVNLPMIRHWTEAIGDANPVYTDAEFAARSVHGDSRGTAGDDAGLDHARPAPGWMAQGPTPAIR